MIASFSIDTGCRRRVSAKVNFETTTRTEIRGRCNVGRIVTSPPSAHYSPTTRLGYALRRPRFDIASTRGGRDAPLPRSIGLRTVRHDRVGSRGGGGRGARECDELGEQHRKFARRSRPPVAQVGKGLPRGGCRIPDHARTRGTRLGGQLPLWQYRYKRISKSICVAKMSYEGEAPTIETGVDCAAELTSAGTAHAVVFWVDYACRVADESRDGGAGDNYDLILTASSSHRQLVRKLLESVAINGGTCCSRSQSVC